MPSPAERAHAAASLYRYAPGDPVESWLHSVLCLDAATHLPRPPAKLPHPSSCDLFYVERDTLFSFHKASEAFLQRVGVNIPLLLVVCRLHAR
jgi:tRNA(Met) C34 N-acetyltransferase TmcA